MNISCFILSKGYEHYPTCIYCILKYVWVRIVAGNPRYLHEYICVIAFWVTHPSMFAGTPLSSTNKTDRHNITKIVLKVVLNTIPHLISTHIPNNWSHLLIYSADYPPQYGLTHTSEYNIYTLVILWQSVLLVEDNGVPANIEGWVTQKAMTQIYSCIFYWNPYVM
jgi:hypothetical protein